MPRELNVVYMVYLGMDRAMAERHLQEAEGHVALGERHIALSSEGLDTAEARRLLETFKKVQQEHVAHRDLLLTELSGD